MGIFSEFLILSAYIGLIIGVIYIGRRYLEARVSYKSQYTMIRIIVLRMLVPINLGVVIPITFNKVINSSVNQGEGAGILDIIFCIWFLGFIISIIYSTLLYIRFNTGVNRYKTKASLTYENIFIQESRSMNINKVIHLNVVEGINTPMLAGIFRVKVLIPNEDFGEEEIRLIFRHELIHYKRRDNLLKLILNIVKGIHWFNPFVYVLERMFNDYCELSCDNQVVQGASISEKKSYAMALLNTGRQSESSRRTVCISGFNKSGVNSIKTRVTSIFSVSTYSKLATRMVLGVCLVLSIVSFNISHNVYSQVYERVDVGTFPNNVLVEDEGRIITKSFVGIPPENKVLEFNINSIK